MSCFATFVESRCDLQEGRVGISESYGLWFSSMGAVIHCGDLIYRCNIMKVLKLTLERASMICLCETTGILGIHMDAAAELMVFDSILLHSLHYLVT